MLKAEGAERRAVPGVSLGARSARGSLAAVQWPVAGGGAGGKGCPFLEDPHAGCRRNAARRVGRLQGQCPGSALQGRAAATETAGGAQS